MTGKPVKDSEKNLTELKSFIIDRVKNGEKSDSVYIV